MILLCSILEQYSHLDFYSKEKYLRFFCLKFPAILSKDYDDIFLKQIKKYLIENKPINIWNNEKLYNIFIHVNALNKSI